MPDIEGLTVLKEIRTIDRQAKVMIFTGGDSPSVEREARALGVTDFLQKGFALPPIAASSSPTVRRPQSSRHPHVRHLCFPERCSPAFNLVFGGVYAANPCDR